MRLGWQFLRDEDKQSLFRTMMDERADCPGPFHLEIDPFDACNANCFFCNSKDIRHGAALPWDRLHRLLEDALPRGLRSIRLSGGGEPTLYPQFIEILHWLTAHRIELDNMTSNGLRLSGQIAETLARTPPTYLMISLNYATPASYTRGMGLDSSRFEQVCRNILNFKRLLLESGRDAACQIHIQFMLNRVTLKDVPVMFELADRLQVYGMTIRGIENQPDDERLTPEERQRFMDEVAPLARKYTNNFWIMFSLGTEGLDVETAALTAEIHAHHDSAPAPDPVYDAFRFCLIPWYTMAVLGSGKVFPCCMLLSNSAVEPLGDLKTQSLAQIWNGPAYRKLRREVRHSMLLGGPVPMAHRLCHHTARPCWLPGGCALAASQPDPDDLEHLANRIRMDRASLGGRAKLLLYGLLRAGIRIIKS